MWDHWTLQWADWFQCSSQEKCLQYFSTVSGSQVMIVCLLASMHNPSSGPLNAISTLLKQSGYKNKATVASLAHSVAFWTGWQNNQGHSPPPQSVPGIWGSHFHPWDIRSEKKEHGDSERPRGLWCCRLCQHCHKIAAWKYDDGSNWGDTLIIISWMSLLLWLVMRLVPFKIDWIRLILQLERKWRGERKLGENGRGLAEGWKLRTKERAEGKNVWARTWECDSKSEKARGTENKLGTFFSQCHWREAFHCQSYSSRFSDGAITSAGGNFV